MAKTIKITAGQVQVQAELNDNPTAKSIAETLPIKAKSRRWGGEIYFSIPVTAELEPDGRDILEEGELGYWPSGMHSAYSSGRLLLQKVMKFGPPQP